jgi:hypothetical protein
VPATRCPHSHSALFFMILAGCYHAARVAQVAVEAERRPYASLYTTLSKASPAVIGGVFLPDLMNTPGPGRSSLCRRRWPSWSDWLCRCL